MMELEIYRHLWGISSKLEDAVARIKREGYAGIEHELPDPAHQADFDHLLSSAGLSFIPMVFSEGATLEEHCDSLSRQVDRAARSKPRFITCHAGLDRWSVKEALAILEHALALETEVDIPLAHETHRGRVLFNPWRAHDLLRRLPEVRICCDYSHWVVVAERLLDEEADVRELCAERCIHVHARVGYEQGPQVPDPRAPEYEEQLTAHERWWEEIWVAQERRGLDVTTLTPEYGPPSYLHTLPYTCAPVSDLWAISLWQATRERTRFGRRKAAR